MILYETSFHYYLVGYDSEEVSFRVLKIDRRVVAPKSLDEILHEDPCVYSKEDLAQMLEMVNEGNRTYCMSVQIFRFDFCRITSNMICKLHV
jgi:hypothetical protein